MIPDTARRQLARLLVAGFLTGALLTGGSSVQGMVQNAVFAAAGGLTLAGLFIWSRDWLSRGAVTALCFALIYVLIILAQLLPLPLEVTGALADRDRALSGLQALGESPQRLPLSLSPEATRISLLLILAPLCGFCLVAAIRWSRGAALLKWVIPLLGAASTCLGLAQVIFSGNRELYPYDITNFGFPVGFFANANHQASFLLMCLPFVAVLAADLRRDWEGEDRDVAQAAATGALGLLILTGIFGAGSAAGYLMLVPVLLFSVAIALSRRRKKTGRVIPVLLGVTALLTFASLAVFSSPRLSGLGQTSLEDGPGTRTAINRLGIEILERHWAAGTGLGSYADVYRLYEDPETVQASYVPQAHNDYLQWLIELGLPGALLLAGFLLWWLICFARLWLGSQADGLTLRRAASVACLVPVLHSLVDYPLRMPAVAVLAAMCLALMVVPQKRAEPVAGEGKAGEGLRTVTL